MIAPALVDGRPLSHPDHDRIWASFVEHGVTPVFHVADQPRVFDDAWYTDDEEIGLVNTIESVFLYTPVALAITDLIVNGTLERHPDLRLGIVELSAIWVPLFLMMLDGAVRFTSKLNGKAVVPLSMEPSEYFRRAGARRRVLVRAPDPIDGPVRRPLHGLQRLPALRGDRHHPPGLRTAALQPDRAAEPLRRQRRGATRRLGLAP